MNTIIFDGKSFAAQKEKELKKRVSALKISPKLISILVGSDKASVLYSQLKQKAAQRIGAKFIIKKIPEGTDYKKIISEIKKYNADKKVHGIMVQLPLPKNISKYKVKILNSIDNNKDVDGLRSNSIFMPATVHAIEDILSFATKDMAYFGKKAAVVGAKGTVGKAAVKMLTKKGYKVAECDKDTRDLYAKLHEADVIVSATGTPNLIKGEMIKEGSVIIDVGAPKGDFDKKAYEVAGFATPVPGGVGPVTVVSLLENLVASLA